VWTKHTSPSHGGGAPAGAHEGEERAEHERRAAAAAVRHVAHDARAIEHAGDEGGLEQVGLVLAPAQEAPLEHERGRGAGRLRRRRIERQRARGGLGGRDRDKDLHHGEEPAHGPWPYIDSILFSHGAPRAAFIEQSGRRNWQIPTRT